MILSDKDLMLLHSMPTSSEPDSSGSQGDLKIGTATHYHLHKQIYFDVKYFILTTVHDPFLSLSFLLPQNSMVQQSSVEFVGTKQVDFIMVSIPAKGVRSVYKNEWMDETIQTCSSLFHSLSSSSSSSSSLSLNLEFIQPPCLG